jgi:hypothetical protein
MKPAQILIVALLISCFAATASAQRIERNWTGIEALTLVEVHGSLDFPNFVPDVENRANITVRLALSHLLLPSISSGNLTVYVLLTPKRNNSLLYFGGNPGAKSYYLTLNCTVDGSSCAAGSVTERTIGVYFKASNSTPLEGDGMVLFASVNPLVSEQVHVGEFALNQTAYEQVSDLQARIMQAAMGLFGLVGQAANATTGALSDISVTVTSNNSSSSSSGAVASITNSTADPLLVAAAQAASDARKSIVAGDYDTGRRLVNESERLLEQYAQKQKQATAVATPSQSLDLSPGVGMFFGALAKPEVAVLVCVLLAAGFLFVRYRGKGNKPRGMKASKSSEYLDFDGL